MYHKVNGLLADMQMTTAYECPEKENDHVWFIMDIMCSYYLRVRYVCNKYIAE